MCYYITAVLPAVNDIATLQAIFHQYKRVCTPLENPSISKILRPGERYYLTTAGPCDCDTTLGRVYSASTTKSYTTHNAKLRKRGWSDTKIQRWMEQKNRPPPALPTAWELSCNADWYELIRAVLQSQTIDYLALLLHHYDTSLTQRIRLHRREEVAISLEALGMMQTDVLYDFYLE